MQIFFRGLDGKTQTLTTKAFQDVAEVKRDIEAKSHIPAARLCLVYAGRQLQDDKPLSHYDIGQAATIHLVLRLCGGKGGFGALLRGAGRAALTDNTDACRDLSGKRLRHANAEKKLREWAKQSKELKQHLADLKRAKEEEKRAAREAGDEAALLAVKQTQRTALAGVMTALQDGLVASGAVQQTKRGAEELAQAETPAAKKARFDLDSFEAEDDLSDSEDDASDDDDGMDELLAGAAGDGSGESDQEAGPSGLKEDDQPSASPQALTDTLVDGAIAEARAPESERLHLGEAVKLEGQGDDVIAVLDFQQFHEAKDLQTLGLDRLKAELQQRGLKCGGTLADRAERLFLLKNMSVDKMEAKHFAKK